MKTTNAFYFGEIKDKHKNLAYKLGTVGRYQFDGYMVEEKGVIFLSIEEATRLQRLRFSNDPDLFRIDIMEPGQKTVTLLK